MSGNTTTMIGSPVLTPAKPKKEAAGPRSKTDDTTYSSAQKIRQAALGGAAAVGLGLAFKNGASTGLHRVGSVASSVSNIVGSFIAFFFPIQLLRNEHNHLEGLASGKENQDDSIFGKMVNTAVSLAYTPVTFCEPLLMATKSKAHLAATIINSPHILFSFFTYTGGRFLSFLKFIERQNAKGDAQKEYRIDQEFNSLFRLGNLGSAQATIIPMSSQCIMGWENIVDMCKGNFSSAWDRTKENPVSSFMGTFFNSWMFAPEWISKCLDTTVRVAEGVEVYKNALSKDPENDWKVKGLRKIKDAWHKTTGDENSTLGKALFKGREFSKICALIVPPIGMISVVMPTINKFLRGDFFNKEAQEIGGAVGGFDKLFSLSAMGMHAYYTMTYGLFVRVPQAVTTSIFYGTSLANWAKGSKPGDKNYVDPNTIRDKIFHKKGGWVEWLSTWAENKLNTMSEDLGEGSYIETDPETGEKKCKQIRTFAKTMLEESWEPVRETHFDTVLQENDGVKDPEKWRSHIESTITETDADGNIVGSSLIDESLEVCEKYLRESYLFDDTKIQYCKDHGDWDKIKSEIVKELNSEYKKLKSGEEPKKERAKVEGNDIPKTFQGLLKNPKALWQTIKMKGSFHRVYSILPLWLKGFVDVVDYGNEKDEWWYRNYKAQITGIKEADVNIACRQELIPVTAFGFQTAGKGLALLHNLAFDRSKFVESLLETSGAY